MKGFDWKDLQNLYMDPLSTPWGQTWAYFHSRGSSFRDSDILKISIFWHETWNLKKVPEVAYGPSFYPKGSKLGLLLLYGQWFLWYGPIFKHTIFGQETCNLQNCQKLHTVLFLLQWVEIELIMGSGFRDKSWFSKLPYLGMKPGIWKKSAKSCAWTLFLPQVAKIEVVFALGAAVSEIRPNFENCHIWTWKLEFEKKCQKLHMDLLSTPGGRNWAYFHFMGSGFRDTGRFWKLPYLGMKPEIWKSARNCLWTLFLPQGVEIKLIFALWVAVSEIQPDFENCHIWRWNLEIEKSARSCIWSLFYPRRSKLSLFSLYRQRFPSYSNFDF